MLLKIICIFVLVVNPEVWGYNNNGDEPSSEYHDEDGDDDFGGYRQDYDEGDNPVRVKRFQAKQTAKTLSPLEIQQVKGAIEKILSGYNQDNPFTPLPPLQGSNEKRSIPVSRDIIKPQRTQSKRENYLFDTRKKFIDYTNVMDVTNSEAEKFTTVPLITDDAVSKISTLITDEDYDTMSETQFIHDTTNSLLSLQIIPSTSLKAPEIVSSTSDVMTTENDATEKTSEIINDETETNTGLTSATITVFPIATLPPVARTDNNQETSTTKGTLDDDASQTTKIKAEVVTKGTLDDDASQTTKINEEDEKSTPESSENVDENATNRKPKRTKGRPLAKPGNKTVVIIKSRSRRTRTKRTTQTTTTKFKLDVPALLAIIANLTYDYEVNLTDKLNRTLHKYSIPTCETPTTTVKRGIFVDYDANATGTIVAKCFVCGLEEDGIPRNAYCADAFAGDFQPMMPADMTARGKLSKYRKYCRFADVPRYIWNMSQPRSVFGRWTGGCSVRWIDLSGVYTQRSCRNRDRAILGRHYVSKRMAKLEMALKHTDNGCITSPMATLVPLSRGISLYARFHACVCTGSWCNAAHIHIPWTGGGFLPLLMVNFSTYLIL